MCSGLGVFTELEHDGSMPTCLLEKALQIQCRKIQPNRDMLYFWQSGSRNMPQAIWNIQCSMYLYLPRNKDDLVIHLTEKGNTTSQPIN
jgi:hypothetical protein